MVARGAAGVLCSALRVRRHSLGPARQMSARWPPSYTHRGPLAARGRRGASAGQGTAARPSPTLRHVFDLCCIEGVGTLTLAEITRLVQQTRGCATRSTPRCARPGRRRTRPRASASASATTGFAGARVQPYTKIGERWLKITAEPPPRCRGRARSHAQRPRRPERDEDRREQPALDVDHHQARATGLWSEGRYSPGRHAPLSTAYRRR